MHKQQVDVTDPAVAREVISMHAYTSGLKAGALTSLVTGVGVYGANKYMPAFRRRLGASGKWALVVSSFLGAFAIVSEKQLIYGARNPQAYLASLDPNYVEVRLQEHNRLKIYQRMANFVYDHPYRTLITTGIPLVGGIFLFQRSNKALQVSQQIMHTRIYGQGAVVLLLLGSMAFNDYMRHHGRFEEVTDEAHHTQ